MSRLLAALTCVALTAACASGAPSPGSSTSATCDDLVLVGVRGQGQSPTNHRGVGAEIDAVASALSDAVDETLRVVAVAHPSAPPSTLDAYLADVAAGRDALTEAIDETVAECPEAEIVLAGFSQGAQILHEVVAASVDDHVRAVVLLGDPTRTASDPVADLGTGAPAGAGSLTGTSLAPVLGDRLINVCVREDNVCNVPAGGRAGPISSAHRRAYEQPEAGGEIAAMIAPLL